MIDSEQEVWTWIPVKERSQTNKPTGQPSSLLYGLIHLPVMCSQHNNTHLNYFSSHYVFYMRIKWLNYNFSVMCSPKNVFL